MNINEARAVCANPKTVPDNARFVIVDGRDGSVLEGWRDEKMAARAALWVNQHEIRNGRGAPYTVQALV